MTDEPGGAATHCAPCPSATSNLWLADTDLDNATRRDLAMFLSRRRGLDGAWYWPLDEIGGTHA